DDDLAAALVDSAEAAADVRRGHQAAVGDQGVRAEDQEVLGAVEVRYRDREGVAEEVAGGEVLGQLVDRGRAVEVLGAQRLVEDAAVQRQREVVYAGVARVHRDGVSSVLLEQRRQPAVDLVERLLPAHLDELAVALDQWRGQAIRVVMQRAERSALRAYVALREDVRFVALDAGDLLVRVQRHL